MSKKPSCSADARLVGQVRLSESGPPVEGATVAAIKAWETEATAIATTDRSGRFDFCLPDGEFALTATSPRSTAAYMPPKPRAELIKSQPALTLGGQGGALRVSVRGRGGPTHLRAIRIGDSIGDIFYAELSADQETIRLPIGSDYRVDLTGAYVSLQKRVSLTQPEAKVELEAHSTVELKSNPSQAVLDWMRAAAIEIADTSPTKTDFADLRRIGEALEDKQVVGFGENSHGVSEFFTFRHRFLAFAAMELGYRVFALETGFARGQAINTYVLGGEGDPAKLLSKLGYWTWDIEELEATLRWMRAYNAKLDDSSKKLKFYGVDMQYASVAFRLVHDFASSHSKELASQVETAQALGDEEFKDFLKLSKADQAKLCDGTGRIVETMDSQRAGLVAKVGEGSWSLARQNAVVLHQACQSFTTQADSTSFRDACMASNLRWILEHEGPTTKAMVWAHNGHVSKSAQGWVEPMGAYLSKALGDRYAAIGQFFSQGEMRAWDTREKDREKLSVLPIKIGQPPRGSVGAALGAVGPEAFFLSLSAPASTEVQRWLQAPHLYRQFSAAYSGAEEKGDLISLPSHFDAVVFIRTVRATKAKPTGLRGPNSR